MKVLLITLLFAYLAMCSTEVQDFEAELPIQYQVEPAEDVFDYYLNFLKGFFISTEENGYPLYKQCDSRWGKQVISSKTLCQVGCLESSVAMALAGSGKKISGATVTPGNLNGWLKSHHGYSGNLFMWGSVSSFGFTYKGQFSSYGGWLSDSHNVVILNVNHGGHWVLATSLSGSTFHVNDPGYSKSTYSKSEVVHYAVFRK